MALTTQTTLVGVFRDEAAAKAVIEELTRSGVPRDRVKMASSQDWAGGAATGGSGLTGQNPTQQHGGFMGWLESIFGSDAPEDYRGNYAETVRRGNYVVAVDANNEAEHDRVVSIMENNNAVDIDEEVNDYRQRGYTGFDPNTRPYTDAEIVREREQMNTPPTGSGTGTGQARSIPVVEEQLQVGKTPVQRGGVRVFTRTLEQPVEQQVNLREEKVNVQRNPVNRPANPAEINALRDQTIEVAETVEKPVVKKQARVVEEVVVGKNVSERTETVRDSVRKQQVQVEQMGAQGTTGTNDPAFDYGYQMASDPRYQGRSYAEVEDALKTDYLRTHPGTTWDRVSAAIRNGWERVTGQR